MKPMLGLLLCMLFLQVHAQDSIPKRLLKFRISVTEITGAKQTGYLGRISDSNVYVSPAQVAIDQPGQYFSVRTAVDFSQIRTIHLRRKGSVGRGILFGALSGLAIGAISGLISGDDPPCPQPAYSNDPLSFPIGAFFTGLSYALCDAFRSTAGEKAVGRGTMGMITGGLIGGIVGAVARKKFIINGSKEKFNAMQLTVLERVYGKGISNP